MRKIIVLTGIIRNMTSWPLVFAKGLAKHDDIQVTVISGYPNINYDPNYREYQLDHPIEEIGNNLKIIRVGSKTVESSQLLYRFFKYVSLTIAINKELKKHIADCCFIYSTPPFLGLLGKTIRNRGEQSVYIAQDLFPDNLFAIKPSLEFNIIGVALRKLEGLIYRSNSEIVTVSHTMKNRISSMGVSEKRIKVISNWADIDSLHHVDRDRNSLFDTYSIDRSKFIVSYAGSLGVIQNIDVLLDAAKELTDYKEIQIVIFGRGTCETSLKKKIVKERINNVIILPMQAENKISEVYSFGDLEYVSVAPGVMRMASPHKILDIMAVGKPLLAAIDKDCDMSEHISNGSMGIVVSSNIKEIKEAIIHAYNNRESLFAMGQNARRFAEQINYDAQINRYISLIK